MMAYPNVFTARKALVAVITTIMMTLVGCADSNIFEGLGDKNSKDAQTEAALMAMDDGDFQTAITILLSLAQNNPGDAHLRQYLSSAYAGAAGLDTLNLLEVIDLLDGTGRSGSVDMIGLVLGDADGQLTAAELAAKLENINSAIETLNLIQTPNDDQIILLGVLSITHFSLALADLILTDLGREDITLTEEGIQGHYGGNPADFSSSSTQTLAAIAQDLANVSAASTALDAISNENNDLAQGMADFQNDINRDQTPGEPITVTADELEAYVNNF